MLVFKTTQPIQRLTSLDVPGIRTHPTESRHALLTGTLPKGNQGFPPGNV